MALTISLFDNQFFNTTNTMAFTFTDENLNGIIAEGNAVVVDFWATWCGPCRAIAPIIEELAHDYEGRVLIGKCDVDECSDAAAEFGIRSIPTLLFFKDGKLVDRHVGGTTRDVLEAKVKALL